MMDVFHNNDEENYAIEQNNNSGLMLLKPIFDACDINNDGFVKVEDLVKLGQKHILDSSGEELEFILSQLDQNGDGLITFQEFSDKIQDFIMEGSGYSVNYNIENEELHREDQSSIIDHQEDFVDSALPQNGPSSFAESEGFYESDTTSQNTNSTADANGDIEELEKRNLVNGITPNYFTKAKKTSSIYSTYPPKRKNMRQSLSLVELQKKQLGCTSEYQSQEEGFEAFGENSVLSDSYQNPHLTSSPHDPKLSRQRLSGSLAARNLRQAHSAQTSLHGSTEEISFEMPSNRHSFSDSEDFSYLNDEIKKLCSQLSLMKMDQESHDDKQKRLYEENRVLLNRINGLEEQLNDQKSISLKVVEQESQKYRKELLKVQRDHSNQIDDLQMRFSEAQQEIENLKSIEPMLRKEIESSLEERRLAQKHIEKLQNEIVDKEKELEHLRYKLKLKNDELEREQVKRTDEVSALLREIENLKYMKNAAIVNFDERQDLLKQIEILKKENDSLKMSEDELNARLIQQSSHILQNRKSLADELVSADKCDVLDALRSEESENHRLKQYIEQLLSLIMQTNPLILEK
ncbi:rab11 family-interacting protein 3 isoform X3 [Hydra vulgaris]|uniref:Rab11 family-interacting protein 3 isoform X3 n=1 Tax=Hydra vulgaris TaxID=6087 RepID=A0ABM4CC79_HYDVU